MPCEQRLARNTSSLRLHRCARSSKASHCVVAGEVEERVSQAALAFDVGFFNGDDTALLLMQGYRVVAIEANEALVEHGRVRFAAALKSGQLVLLHQALAMTSKDVGTTQSFYVNRHVWQWSSFDPKLGCRAAPRDTTPLRDLSSAIGRDCDVRSVRAESCAALFERFGTPLILKLDIEGSERPCVEALLLGTERPSYVALEQQPYSQMAGTYAQLHALGYDSFKWSDQLDLRRAPEFGQTSGPIGEGGRDCHYGYGWRNLSSVRRLHRHFEARQASHGVDLSASTPPDAAGCSDQAWSDLHARHRLVRSRFEPWGQIGEPLRRFARGGRREGVKGP